MERINKLFRWGNLVVILLTFFSYLSPYINPEVFWPMTFFGIAYPWLLLANFLFLLFWIFRKDRYFLFSLACIIMGWGHLTRFVGWHFPEKAVTLSETVRVLSYNMAGLHQLTVKRKIDQARYDNLISFFNTTARPDIVCGQEIIGRQHEKLAKSLNLPYVYKNKQASTIIISRFPFIEKGGETFKGSSNSYVWADVVINDRRVRIFSAHLQSNKVSSDADKVILEGDIQEKETWSNIRTVISKIKSATKTRSEQAKELAAAIRASPYPVIVCGDFNDTPQSYTYHLVSQGLQDAFNEKGFGFGTTYAGNIRALRIDYILADPGIKVLNYEIPKVSFSDHYPVISSLAIPRN